MVLLISRKMSESNSYNSYSSNNEDNEPCCSTNIDAQSQVECLENTAIMTDDFSLVDVLFKFKVQVKALAERLNLFDQMLSLNKNPTNPTTHQEVLKIKKNIINSITCLLKETKPLNYPNFQSLTSVKLLKLYEKVSAESVLLLNSIKHEDEKMIKNMDKFNNLSIFIKDLQQEIDNCVAKNTINAEIEEKVAREFKECKSDMYSLLSQLSPSSTLKETLSLLLEYNDQDSEDAWLNVENMPHLIRQCYELKFKGFVIQNEQNKNLFKFNI